MSTVIQNNAKQHSAQEKIIESTVRLDHLVNQASLSYCQHDIVDPGFSVIEKMWNNREALPAAVKKLVESLETIGLQITRQGTAIPLGIKSSWIEKDNLVESMDGLMPDQLPMLTLTDEGQKAADQGLIEAFQGGHRKKAAMLLYQKAKAVEAQCKKEIEKLKKDKEKSRMDIERLTVKMEVATKSRNTYCMWSYHIIDIGKEKSAFNDPFHWECSYLAFVEALDCKTRDDVYKHLAQNEQHAIQHETSEEAIMKYGADLLRAMREDDAETAKAYTSTPITTAYTKELNNILESAASKYTKIFSDEGMTGMFLRLLTLRNAFCNTEVLKLNFLTKNIGNHHSGVRFLLMSCTSGG